MNFLQRIRDWLTSSPVHPPSTPTPSSAEPLGLHAALIDALIAPPAARQEQFAEQKEQVNTQRDLYQRVVATNNRNVTRDYGTHTEELINVGGKYAEVRDATDDDYKDLEKYGTKVTDLAARRAQERRLVDKSPTAQYRAPAVLAPGKFGRGRFE